MDGPMQPGNAEPIAREAWLELESEVLVPLLRERDAQEPVRAWVPHVGTTSAAVGLTLGLLHAARQLQQRRILRVLATSSDPQLLGAGRQGRLPAREAEAFPPAWREGRLIPVGDGALEVIPAVRRQLVFTRHDFGHEPPFTRLDLVLVHGPVDPSPHVQTRIGEQLDVALRQGGYLWLTEDGLPIPAEPFERLAVSGRGYRKIRRSLRGVELDEIIDDVITHERMRVGEELHDAVGQQIAGASLLVHRLKSELQRDPALAAATVLRLEETLARARQEVRTVARAQLPLDAGRRPFPDALRSAVEHIRVLVPVDVEVLVATSIGPLPGETAAHLLRIAQEAIRNASSGGAKRVDVELREEAEHLVLRIRDDGRGISPEHVEADVGGGLGLRIMRHRARAIGARLRFEPAESGTIVSCALPLSRL